MEAAGVAATTAGAAFPTLGDTEAGIAVDTVVMAGTADTEGMGSVMEEDWVWGMATATHLIRSILCMGTPIHMDIRGTATEGSGAAKSILQYEDRLEIPGGFFVSASADASIPTVADQLRGCRSLAGTTSMRRARSNEIALRLICRSCSNEFALRLICRSSC